MAAGWPVCHPANAATRPSCFDKLSMKLVLWQMPKKAYLMLSLSKHVGRTCSPSLGQAGRSE